MKTDRLYFENISFLENISFYTHAVLSEDFVCFVALHPKSTAMVMVGRSVHLTTLFPGQA